MTLVYDGTACRVYRNGAFSQSVSGEPSLAAALAVGCRCNGNGDMTFRGSVDEVRITGTQLPADWIQAEYDMTGVSAQFLSFDEIMKIHVVPAGTAGNVPTPPYDTWARAANDLATAVAYNTDGFDVRIAPGTYPVTSQLSLNNPGATYACVDPSTGTNVCGGAVLDGGSKSWTSAGVVLNSASIRGFTIANFTNTANAATGAGLYVSASSDRALFIADTIFTNCCITGSSHASGGGAYLANGYYGTVTNCRFVCNAATDGGGLYANNAASSPRTDHPTVIDTLFAKNSVCSDWGAGGAVRAGGVLFSNCTFRANGIKSGLSSYSPTVDSLDNDLQFDGCLFVDNQKATAGNGASCVYGCSYVRNCTFTRNGADVTSDGTLENSFVTNNNGRGVTSPSLLRNCLIANNGDVGVYQLHNGTTNRIENCTIVNNASYGIQDNSTDQTACLRTVIVNSILTGNDANHNNRDYATWRADNDCIISNSVVTTLHVTAGHDASEDRNRYTYSKAAVLFADEAAGDFTPDYRLRGASLLKEQAALSDWMDGATDLDGNPRVLNRRGEATDDALPDIGAFECTQPAPAALIVK